MKLKIKSILASMGPGFMIAVGYLDPGNWATDLAAGSQYGYSLLFMILLSNLLAILLQYLSLKLGIVTNLDLAQSCRKYLPKKINIVFYVLCEIAIIACDLAEIIGTAIALKLLFGIRIEVGVALTGLDVLLVMGGWGNGSSTKIFEFLIMIMVMIVAGCFAVLVHLSSPNWIDKSTPANGGDADKLETETETNNFNDELNHIEYIPVNELIKSDSGHTISEKLIYSNIDSSISLFIASLVNAAILIVAAASFHTGDNNQIIVADLQDGQMLLIKHLGTFAGTIFAIGLLMSGQSSTITGTLSGQVVMEGFLGTSFKIPPWSRRLITRLLAIVPSMTAAILKGEEGMNELLVLSQVWPLVYFTCSPDIMKCEKNKFLNEKAKKELNERLERENSAASIEDPFKPISRSHFKKKGNSENLGNETSNTKFLEERLEIFELEEIFEEDEMNNFYFDDKEKLIELHSENFENSLLLKIFSVFVASLITIFNLILFIQMLRGVGDV
ncbi:hypothetical protein HK099_001187 [Clydaea vesicula]|uniref:Natural resistance-associated macrophage protein n=1 Tax=Clydaea vesicula TaxID=447962 RepID=A0AAD5U872_9FUNG|nr:hypothetical protein HK099_001187 [Clydaea vesicula]